MRQEGLARAILDPELPVPDGILTPLGDPAGKRFDVYRNNVIVGLIDALADGFPVVNRLVGDAFFRAMARDHARRHPPRSPLMFRYGDRFPEFIAGYGPAAKLPYLADVARLEWAVQEALHAGDAEPCAPDRLAEVPDAMLDKVVLELLPSTRVLASPYPVLSIWRANTGPDTVEIPPRAESVVVARPALETELRPLPPGGAEFLNAIVSGKTLGGAAALASEVAGFDLAGMIGVMLGARLISEVATKERSHDENAAVIS